MNKHDDITRLVDHYLTWSPAQIKAFRKTLLAWYDREGRDLPWRKNHDPYQIMISEVMLQQTQVQTVLPYYQHFMQVLPTVGDLAAISEEKLLTLWSGLGYYSRARHLRQAARQLMQDYQGVWPKTPAELQTLSGIGPYTANAIASIAFNVPVPAVDGNALRVFARLFKIDLDITKPKTKRVFAALIQRVIDPKRPGDFNQAIMDLGSSYLTAKNPDPKHSPVANFDASARDGTTLDYPVRTRKAKPKAYAYFALAIHSPAGWLLQQRPASGLLARMWTFPLIDRQTLSKQTEKAQMKELQQNFADQVQFAIHLQKPALKPVSHVFTHQRWQVRLLVAELETTPDLALFPGRWVPAAEFDQWALPTLQRKLWDRLQKGGTATKYSQ